jgi:hypothetical protein
MNDEARRTLEKLKQQAKKISVAQIGGFRPPEDPRTSWFGGGGVGMPGELLPTYRSREMFPLLQVNVEELPFVPPQLAGLKLIILFLNREEIPFDRPHGEGWLIREYSELEGLVPLPPAEGPPGVRSFPIKWNLEEDERPGWEDAWQIVDLGVVNEDEEASAYFFEKLRNYPGTKIGGYPTEIQHGVGFEDFVFQVGSEEKPQWQWADNGIGYFFKKPESQWRFACQFY